MERARPGLRLPVALNERLSKLAQEKGVSKNALMLEILWRFIRREDGAVNPPE